MENLSVFEKLTFDELNSVIDVFKTKNITEDNMKKTISAICELALDGQAEISKCAELCLKLIDTYKSTFEHKKQNKFKMLLLAHCRVVFEKQKSNFFRIYYIPEDDKQNHNDTELMTKLRLQPVMTTLFFAELYLVGIMSCKIIEYFMKVLLDPVFINKITLECFCLLVLKTKEKYCQQNGKGLLVEMVNQIENNCHFLTDYSCTKAKELFQKVVEFVKDQNPQNESYIPLIRVAEQTNDINYNEPVNILKNINIGSIDEISNVLSLIFKNVQFQPSFATYYAKACAEAFHGKLNDETIQNILEILIEHNMESAHKDLLVIRKEQFEDLDIARRIIGLVNFITDFYKVGFLLPKHVHAHIEKLLDTNLICDCSCHLTCIIMFACGDKLHYENYNLDVIQGFMVKLRKYCDNIEISSKTRFMAQKLNKLQKHWKTIVANLNVGDSEVHQQVNQPTDEMEKFCSIIHALTETNIADASQKSFSNAPEIVANKSIDTTIYSHVLNYSFPKVIAEPVVEMEEHEPQQIVPKIDDFNEFPPVLAEKKKKKTRSKKTLKIISNSLPVVVNPSINNEIQICRENGTTNKDLTETSFEIADKALVKDKIVENIQVNPSNISLYDNIPLNKESSMYNEFFQLNHEYNLENKHLYDDKLGSITSILNDLMMNNVTGEFLDICLIDLLKNVISDPSLTTLKVRDISTSFCNKPMELHAKRDFILKRLIIVSLQKFSNTIFLANTMLGYNKLIGMMDKIQRERNTECRKQLKAELEDALDLRYCAVNIVKFLGELVNFEILSPKIIQSFKPLLDNNVNPITIECFCELFKTVGLKMETELGNVIMNECFLKLVNILNMFHTQTIILCPSVSILISEVLQLRLSLKVNNSNTV